MRVLVDVWGDLASERHDAPEDAHVWWLLKSVVLRNVEHDVLVVLSSENAAEIDFCRFALGDVLSQDRIRVWSTPLNNQAVSGGYDATKHARDELHRLFLESLAPDVVFRVPAREGPATVPVASDRPTYPGLTTVALVHDLAESSLCGQRRHGHPAPGVWSWRNLQRLDGLVCLCDFADPLQGGEPSPDDRLVYRLAAGGAEGFQALHQDGVHADRSDRGEAGTPFVLFYDRHHETEYLEHLLRAWAAVDSAVRDHYALRVTGVRDQGRAQEIRQIADKAELDSQAVVIDEPKSIAAIGRRHDQATLTVFYARRGESVVPLMRSKAHGSVMVPGGHGGSDHCAESAELSQDPRNLAGCLTELLNEPGRLSDLDTRGAVRPHTWSSTADAVWHVLSEVHRKRETASKISHSSRRPRLAYVSPLPPVESGISDYSEELLPFLADHYEIELIVNQEKIEDSPKLRGFPARTVSEFWSQRHRYDRIVYHIGNSDAHKHMFDMARMAPGTVVLHDFFLSSLMAHMDGTGFAPGAFVQSLKQSHGWAAVAERYDASDVMDVVWKYPANMDIIANSKHVIVHSNYAKTLAARWYGPDVSNHFQIVPMVRAQPRRMSSRAARQRLGIPDDALVVVSFGGLSPLKLNDVLLDAWGESGLAKSDGCRLIFAGASKDADPSVLDDIDSGVRGSNVRVTGWLSKEAYVDHLLAADIAVQLRSRSRGETSAAALDCLNYGIATVLNANGPMAEFPREVACILPDECDVSDVSDALTLLASDSLHRTKLGAEAARYVEARHRPQHGADAYSAIIERAYDAATHHPVEAGAKFADRVPDAPETLWAGIAQSLDMNHARAGTPRTLFLDVSELAVRDIHTGIQRVVRALLQRLLRSPPPGWTVEPVYASQYSEGFYYARKFTSAFLGCAHEPFEDEPIAPRNGDIFLGLDLTHPVAIAQRPYYRAYQRMGVDVWFVVYDLLPVILPDCFPSFSYRLHWDWLSVVSEADGAICISESTRHDFEAWCGEHGSPRYKPIKTRSFPLGADLRNSVPTYGIPDGGGEVLERLAARTSFLLVGTVEPRKGHTVTLDAFERMWASGDDVALVFVGKQGWLVDQVAQRVRAHPENGKRLFWLDNVSDEYLEAIYKSCACVIMPSFGEGYGLPIVEAAMHDKPIIARDLPVFREVAGDSAYYVSAASASDLAAEVREWLQLYRKGRAPEPSGIKCHTWQESAEHLLASVVGEDSMGGPMRDQYHNCRLTDHEST